MFPKDALKTDPQLNLLRNCSTMLCANFSILLLRVHPTVTVVAKNCIQVKKLEDYLCTDTTPQNMNAYTCISRSHNRRGTSTAHHCSALSVRCSHQRTIEIHTLYPIPRLDVRAEWCTAYIDAWAAQLHTATWNTKSDIGRLEIIGLSCALIGWVNMTSFELLLPSEP